MLLIWVLTVFCTAPNGAVWELNFRYTTEWACKKEYPYSPDPFKNCKPKKGSCHLERIKDE